MPSRSTKLSRLSHVDRKGDAQMVHVGGKPVTARYAKARALLEFPPGTLRRILRAGGPKGGVLGPARLAGIQAAKKTADWIPLCHALPLDRVALHFEVAGPACLQIICEVWAEAKTGVEMEALTGVTAAALTVYDMSKAVSKALSFQDIRLIEKRGGKSGDYLWDAKKASVSSRS